MLTDTIPTMNKTKFSQTKNPAVILSSFRKRTSKESPAYTKTFQYLRQKPDKRIPRQRRSGHCNFEQTCFY